MEKHQILNVEFREGVGKEHRTKQREKKGEGQGNAALKFGENKENSQPEKLVFLILPCLQNLGIYPGIAGGSWSAGQHFLFELFLSG